MTYKQITRERHKIEPYFINIEKEYYKDINLSNVNYIGQIENILHENNRGITEYYVNKLMDILTTQVYYEMSYKSKYEKICGMGDDYYDIKYLIIKWNDIEMYIVAYDDITYQKHSMKELLRVILCVVCCVQQRRAIKNIVKFNPFDK